MIRLRLLPFRPEGKLPGLRGADSVDHGTVSVIPKNSVSGETY